MIQTVLLVILVLLSMMSLAWSIFSGVSSSRQRQRQLDLIEYLASLTVHDAYTEDQPEWCVPYRRTH